MAAFARAGFVRQPLAFPLRRLCAGRRLAKLLLLALQHGVLFLQFAVKNLFRFQLFERVRLLLKRNALRRVVFANPAYRHIQQQQNAAERAEELKQNLRFPGSNGKRRRIALLPSTILSRSIRCIMTVTHSAVAATIMP